MPRYITGSDAVKDVLRGLGLPVPQSVSDSQDPTVRQMWQLATDAGQFLVKEHDWQILEREHTINTQVGVSAYPFPADLDSYVSDSQWNSTTRLPALGSLKEFEWQALKARNLAGTTFTLLFRIDDDTVLFYEMPSSVQTIVLPYKSRNWVRKADQSRVDVLAANDDLILFDSLLFKLQLKLRWLTEKKFDTTAARAEFDKYLSSVTSKDTPSRTLSMRGGGDYPYLGYLNIPDTRYGS